MKCFLEQKKKYCPKSENKLLKRQASRTHEYALFLFYCLVWFGHFCCCPPIPGLLTIPYLLEDKEIVFKLKRCSIEANKWLRAGLSLSLHVIQYAQDMRNCLAESSRDERPLLARCFHLQREPPPQFIPHLFSFFFGWWIIHPLMLCVASRQEWGG